MLLGHAKHPHSWTASRKNRPSNYVGWEKTQKPIDPLDTGPLGPCPVCQMASPLLLSVLLLASWFLLQRLNWGSKRSELWWLIQTSRDQWTHLAWSIPDRHLGLSLRQRGDERNTSQLRLHAPTPNLGQRKTSDDWMLNGGPRYRKVRRWLHRENRYSSYASKGTSLFLGIKANDFILIKVAVPRGAPRCRNWILGLCSLEFQQRGATLCLCYDLNFLAYLL